MKEKIHPKFQESKVSCACGNVIETFSVNKEMKVEICSNCHPFYTGKQKSFLGKKGQVEKFRQRYGIQGVQEEQ